MRVFNICVNIAIVVILSGCTSEISHIQPRFERNIGPIRLVSNVEIAQDRRLAKYEFDNKSRFDIVCENLNVRAIMDDPNTYLETSEKVVSIGSIFIREDAAIRGEIHSSKFVEGTKAHIRAVSLVEGGPRCRRAKFSDYCHLAEKSGREDATIVGLLRRYNVGRCEELVAQIGDSITLDITGLGEVSLRPLIYLSALRELVVDDIQENRNQENEFRKRSVSENFLGYHYVYSDSMETRKMGLLRDQN
jgi:hypothetical protein